MQVEFKLDPAKLSNTYECEVEVTIGEKTHAVVPGSVRPTPGKSYPTINQGKYVISLGLHWRKTNLMRDPSILTAQQYKNIRESKTTFGATTKKYLKEYVAQRDGSWKLSATKKQAFGWMRKILTIADPDKDKLIISTKSGAPRLCLVVEHDKKSISVTRPLAGSNKRMPGKASHVHIHSGPNDERGAAGCLTVPAKSWGKFLSPILKTFPCGDDWLSRGYMGKDIGYVTVVVKNQ